MVSFPINKEAENFYFTLVQNKAIQDNREIYDRLIELNYWQNAFITLLKHTTRFGVKINEKNETFWKKILTKNQFTQDQIKEILPLIVSN